MKGKLLLLLSVPVVVVGTLWQIGRKKKPSLCMFYEDMDMFQCSLPAGKKFEAPCLTDTDCEGLVSKCEWSEKLRDWHRYDIDEGLRIYEKGIKEIMQTETPLQKALRKSKFVCAIKEV